MKKTKLLAPIIGLAAAGSIVAPIVTLTSCTEQSKQFIIEEKVIKEPERAMLDGSSGETKIKGFKLDDKRSGFGLKVEIINQSFSSADLTATVEIAEDEVTFDVIVNADIITTRQVITFDLKFTNARGYTFTSTGYKLDLKPLKWLDGDIAYGEKDGKEYYFDAESSGLFNPSAYYISSEDGTKFPRETFDMELWINPRLSSTGDNFLINCSAFNSGIHIPETIKRIERGFLFSCNAFNQPIILPTSLEEIGPSFLSYCWSFNQPIDIPAIKSWSLYAFYSDQKFNSDITIDCSNLVDINLDSFLCECPKMEGTITFKNSKFAENVAEWSELYPVWTCYAFMTSYTKEDPSVEEIGPTIVFDNQDEADAFETALTDSYWAEGEAEEFGDIELNGWIENVYGNLYYRYVDLQVAE